MNCESLKAKGIVYITIGEALIILLCGRDKSSQQADIRTAKAMAKELE